MDLFTIQVGRWRLARNRDIVFMDTTVKSGNSLFAPTWDMVLSHKAGTMSDEEYTKAYYDRLNASWKTKHAEWVAFLHSTDPTALGCYCRSDRAYGTFCHRYLLVDVLKKLCEREGIPFAYYGELTP